MTYLRWIALGMWRRTYWGRCQHRHGGIEGTYPPRCAVCIYPIPGYATTED